MASFGVSPSAMLFALANASCNVPPSLPMNVRLPGLLPMVPALTTNTPSPALTGEGSGPGVPSSLHAVNTETLIAAIAAIDNSFFIILEFVVYRELPAAPWHGVARHNLVLFVKQVLDVGARLERALPYAPLAVGRQPEIRGAGQVGGLGGVVVGGALAFGMVGVL